MNVIEKILCHNAIGLEEAKVKSGDMICVKVAWTLASELTWNTMDRAFSDMGRPKIWRADRFWLAVDHTVDPRINHQPKPKKLIKLCRDFAQEAGLTNFQEPNTTILHTEFTRTRVQPGQVVCGADSHSCSSGCMGTFSVGLGAADVLMPLVTGETWIEVPKTLKVVFTGKPAFGIGGKDIMLATMGQLKRNSVALERAVEYHGNICHLSVDSRFAISNLTAEFGGVVGVFPGDELTALSLSRRKDHNSDAVYFKADDDAKYVQVCEINMSNVVPQIALFPSPDNCVPVTQVIGKELDGVFIGACTTAEEEFILAGLLLEVMLKEGHSPISKGRRIATPGSIPITENLKRMGLLEVYEKAGFYIGAPSCSMCIGVGADVAGDKEVWLSSQNRNFPNRMGPGSIANLASAATVAASSFSLKIVDPTPYLAKIDQRRFDDLRGAESQLPKIVFSEPKPILISKNDDSDGKKIRKIDGDEDVAGKNLKGNAGSSSTMKKLSGKIEGRIQLFGDNIDTDAIIPAQFMHLRSNKELGEHAFEHVRPEFRQRAKDGQDIVVAGIGWGCGSSREEAVTTLQGAGIKAVIAKSFAFIHARNLSNMALIAIRMNDEEFYKLAKENGKIVIDLEKEEITVASDSNPRHDHDNNKVFKYGMSLIEKRLHAAGGVVEMYRAHGNSLFRHAVTKEDAW